MSLEQQSIMVISAILGGMSLAAYFYALKKSASKEEAEKPLIERGKKELEERRNKLRPFMVPRTLLYCDEGQFDGLYLQSQLKSEMEITSLKETITQEISHAVDAKVLSTKGKKTKSEERISKERINREMKYQSILRWLYDENSLILGLEKEPPTREEREKLIEQQLSTFHLKFAGVTEKIEQEIKERLKETLLAAGGKLENEKLRSVKNKYIALLGDFEIHPREEKKFELILDKSYTFYVLGVQDYCTPKGNQTFSRKGKIRAGVLGFVSDANEEIAALLVDPIAVYRLST